MLILVQAYLKDVPIPLSLGTALAANICSLKELLASNNHLAYVGIDLKL